MLRIKFITYSMSKAVLQPFEQYQKARVSFVQTVAELATRPQNIQALQSAGVMSLLRPLLLDNVPSISQSAALALGRLANMNEELAESVVNNEILPQLVMSLNEQNVKHALFSDSTKRQQLSFSEPSPNIQPNLLKQLLTQELFKHWSSVSKNLIPPSRKLQLGHFLILQSILLSWLCLLWKWEQSLFWCYVFKNHSPH